MPGRRWVQLLTSLHCVCSSGIGFHVAFCINVLSVPVLGCLVLVVGGICTLCGKPLISRNGVNESDISHNSHPQTESVDTVDTDSTRRHFSIQEEARAAAHPPSRSLTQPLVHSVAPHRSIVGDDSERIEETTNISSPMLHSMLGANPTHKRVASSTLEWQ